MWEKMADKGGKTSAQAHMWETMGHKRRQGETRPREGERSTHKGKQWVTRRDKTSGRRTHLTMGDKRRQDPGKADTASNAGTHAGKTRRQGQTRPREGGRISQRKGRQDVGKADAPANTGTHVGRQWETMGDKQRQDLGKADAPSKTGTHVWRQWETRGGKTAGRRDTASNGHTCGVTMGDKNRQTM